ncbi:MAG: flagellar biosynthetic protein FliO [Pirellulaceae bacterium]
MQRSRKLGLVLGLFACQIAGVVAWGEEPYQAAANQRQTVRQTSLEPSPEFTAAKQPPPFVPDESLSDLAGSAADRALPPRGTDLSLPPKSEIQSTAIGFVPPNLNLGKTGSIAASLGVVIGLFLVFAWVGKKKLPKLGGPLPKEVFQVVGKSQLSGKQKLELVRVGGKLILLCVSNGGVETLTEITDPTEVERLLALVRQDSPGSISGSFHEILSQVGGKPTRGFLDA